MGVYDFLEERRIETEDVAESSKLEKWWTETTWAEASFSTQLLCVSAYIAYFSASFYILGWLS